MFQKSFGFEGGGRSRGGLCQGQNHAGHVPTVPSLPPAQTRGARAEPAAIHGVTSELKKGKHTA